MSEKNKHTDSNDPMMGDNFFVNGKFHWKKTEGEVWAEIEQKLNDSDTKPVRKLHFGPRLILVAASVTLLLGILSFLRFYSTSTYIPSGVHEVASLPDGSNVHLNAESTLKYYPLWWKVNRIISFEGEGFFEVQKGNKFIVKTQHGNIEVLGTSFNVFARDEVLKITCVTGSVKVTSTSRQQVILTPNSKAELYRNSDIKLSKDIDSDYERAWQNNNFRFESVSLEAVFQEIARQYGVKIEMRFSTSAVYSGNFYKNDNVEDVLIYVCTAMGLKYEKKSDTEYIVLQE